MSEGPSQIPTFDQLMQPTIDALKALGGSGTVDEIYQKVTQLLSLPSVVLEISHGKTGQSEIEYRLAWSRTYLKKAGILENSSRGVWAISQNVVNVDKLNVKEIVKSVREADKRKITKHAEIPGQPDTEEEPPDEIEAALTWQEQLHALLCSLTSAAFERLAQRLLRESGFTHVEVTGRSGDGGIDGIGIARIAGFLSFQVLFQCKRYQGSITPSQIRDFRGAMQGRTDKGLFITTGTFTKDAVKEATRDGAPPIDLIDGEQLVIRLKELGLGVKIKMVESVEIDEGWFDKI